MSWLLYNTLAAGGLALLAWSVCRLLRPAPALGHLLWLLVLVKLVLPPLWSLELAPPPARASIAAAGEAAPGAMAPPLARVSVSEGGAGRATASPPPLAAPIPARRIAGPSLAELLPWLWLLGSTVFLLAAALGCRRLAARMASGRPAPPALRRQAQALAERLGVAAPEIVVLDDLAAPCVWSLGRPRLLWPAALLSAPGPKVRGLLVHELAHLRRRDHVVARFEFCAAAAFFWHPLFWLARSQLRQQAELACDAWALWAEPAARFHYADALIGTLQTGSRVERALPVLGARPGARRSFERRLHMILHRQVSQRPSRLAAAPLAALTLALLPGLTVAQERTERRGQNRQQLEQRIEREVRQMVREILREELGRQPQRSRPERSRQDIRLRVGGEDIELDPELQALLERYVEQRKSRADRRPRRDARPPREPERRGGGLQGVLGGELGQALREGLAEARAEIANDPDLVEMGIAGDLQDLLGGLFGEAEPAAMSGALRNVIEKAMDFGLQEARAELEAEGLDPAFLDHLAGALRSGIRGDEERAGEEAGRFGLALQQMIGQSIEMGLQEARAELQAEGFDDVRFLEDLGGLLEATLSGRESAAEDSARRLQESFQGFLGGALKKGLDEARAELQAEGIDPGFLDEIERSLRDGRRRR